MRCQYKLLHTKLKESDLFNFLLVTSSAMHPQTSLMRGVLLLLVLLFAVKKVVESIRNRKSQGPYFGEDIEEADIRNSRPLHNSRVEGFAWYAFHPVVRMFNVLGTPSPVKDSGTQKYSLFQALSAWIGKLNPFRSSSRVEGSSNKLGSNEYQRGNPPRPNGISYHAVTINSIGVAYHNPFSPRNIKGIGLLIHGCGQDASDWFELPEHRHVAAHLLRRRLALLAISSGNRVNGCWSTRFPHWQNEDVERVIIAVNQWSSDHNIPPTAPIYGVGVSSGATMLSVLAASNLLPSLASQALYISPGNQRAFRNASEVYPNTLFIHLTTDQHYASPAAIATARKILLKRKVELVGELPLGKLVLTPLLLHEREPRISVEMSKKIFSVLDLHREDMEKAMRVSTSEEVVELWSDRNLRRSVKQVIRVVNGQHELLATHAEKMADWLIRNGRRINADSTSYNM